MAYKWRTEKSRGNGGSKEVKEIGENNEMGKDTIRN